MSEFEFEVTKISANLADQSIYIGFSLDIDEDSVNPANVYVMEHGLKRIVPFHVSVDGSRVQLKLTEWASPNTTYDMIIQPGIRNIVDEEIKNPLIAQVTFESSVVSETEIIYPADFQKIKTLKLKWNETGKEEDLVGKFYIEVASDNAFYDIVYSSTVIGNEIEMKDPIEAGQYYFRIRPQKSPDDYGKWSDIRTFVYEAEKADEPGTEPVETEESAETISIEDSDDASENVSTDPIIIDDDEEIPEEAQLIAKPENGETPVTFDFLFDKEIDATNATITIVRSDF